MSAPLVTVFVRHAEDCKYVADELWKRCQCRKHFRWTANGKQHRQKAGTRSWAEAEELKRDLEARLSGRSAAPAKDNDLTPCIAVFIQDKQVQGVTSDVLAKYRRELDRLQDYANRAGVYTVQGLTREVLTGYAGTWSRLYPSTQTRAAVRTRCRSFLRYCYEAQWLPRIPALPKITVAEPPTMPLTAEQYEALLAACEAATTGTTPQKARALVLLMRWTGLAIRDSLTLPKASIVFDPAKRIYRVVTSRQKTGTDVSVPIPPGVAEELLAVDNSGAYVFWDGKSDIVKSYTKYVLGPLFTRAGIAKEGNMVSHRLRDTFAVELLGNGVPLEEVSKLLGHESIKTTERSYAKWVPSRQNRLDDLVTGTW